MSSMLSSRTGLSGSRLASRPVASRRTSRCAVRVHAAGQYQWLNKDPTAIVGGVLGWLIPSNIPVSAFGGNSLFGLFNASIGENLAKFPVGPALTDKFWLYLITWHMGLFLCMFLGQIGVQARKQQYF